MDKHEALQQYFGHATFRDGQEEVVDAILNIDQINEEYKERYEEFYKRFCCYDDGNASKHIVEEVFK